MKKIKVVITKLLNWIPTETPVGAAEFEVWANNILITYGFPLTPGYKQALATMLLHEKSYKISKRNLAIALRKGQVNETAYQIMKDIQQQKKAAEDLINATQKDTQDLSINKTSMVQ